MLGWGSIIEGRDFEVGILSITMDRDFGVRIHPLGQGFCGQDSSLWAGML